MEEINILYTVDHNYAKYMLVSVCSVIESNPFMKINIHILGDKLELEDYKMIESIIKDYMNVNLHIYDFRKVRKLIEEYNIPNWRGTKIANARLFFSEFIKGVDRFLYLDSDTIVVNSLKGLDSFNGPIHMVQDSMSTKYWKKLSPTIDKYCNSGVLWINVDKWMEIDADAKIREKLEENVSYIYPDQDLLNVALEKDIELLPPEYNLFTIDSYINEVLLPIYYERAHVEKYSIEEMINAKKNPIILHATPLCSFKFNDSAHPYNRIISAYLQRINRDESKKFKESTLLHYALFKLYFYAKLACPDVIYEQVRKLVRKNH